MGKKISIHLLKSWFVIVLCFFNQACNENNSFYAKEASSINSDKNNGGDLLPFPEDEEKPPSDDEDNDKEKPPGDDEDSDKEKPPGDDEDSDEEKSPDDDGSDDKKDGDNQLPCPKKIDSTKIKNGEIKWEQIACDSHKVVICHKKSTKIESKFEIIFVDHHAIDSHIHHQDQADFLLDCKKLNISHKFIVRKTLEDRCNCQ